MKVIQDKYYRHIYTGDGWQYEETPGARSITLPSFEQYEFFAHRDPVVKGYWIITEAQTGMLVWGARSTARGLLTMAQVTADRLRKRLAIESTNMDDLIQKEIAKYGLSPR